MDEPWVTWRQKRKNGSVHSYSCVSFLWKQKVSRKINPILLEHVISTELVALLLPENTVSKKGLARRKARNSCGSHWLEAWCNVLCVTEAIEAFPVMVNYTPIQQCTNSTSKTKNSISSLHQKWRFSLFRHFRDWKPPNLPESFVFIATKILFF